MRTWQTPAAAAISHARRGWVVVPLKPGTGMPARKWKHLVCTPPGSVARWWPGPQFNPGILTGPSSLAVFDLDTAEAHPAELPPEWASTGITSGSEALTVLAERAREVVPPTHTVISWRGGIHLYFEVPRGRVIRNSAGKIAPWIDIRSRGGLIVGAGSIRGGRLYELADDRDPVPLPAWLAELATRPKPATATVPSRNNTTVAVVAPGRGYGAAALRSEVATLTATARGGRNHALNRAAYSLGQLVGSGDLTETELTDALMAAAESIGLVADDGTNQCQRTIASGMDAGIAQPRIRRAA